MVIFSTLIVIAAVYMVAQYIKKVRVSEKSHPFTAQAYKNPAIEGRIKVSPLKWYHILLGMERPLNIVYKGEFLDSYGVVQEFYYVPAKERFSLYVNDDCGHKELTYTEAWTRTNKLFPKQEDRAKAHRILRIMRSTMREFTFSVDHLRVIKKDVIYSLTPLNGTENDTPS